MLVRVEPNVRGRRLYIGRWRWHHFHSGFALIAFGAKLVWGDRLDLQEIAARGTDKPVRGGAPRRELPRRETSS